MGVNTGCVVREVGTTGTGTETAVGLLMVLGRCWCKGRTFAWSNDAMVRRDDGVKRRCDLGGESIYLSIGWFGRVRYFFHISPDSGLTMSLMSGITCGVCVCVCNKPMDLRFIVPTTCRERIMDATWSNGAIVENVNSLTRHNVLHGTVGTRQHHMGGRHLAKQRTWYEGDYGVGVGFGWNEGDWEREGKSCDATHT